MSDIPDEYATSIEYDSDGSIIYKDGGSSWDEDGSSFDED